MTLAEPALPSPRTVRRDAGNPSAGDSLFVPTLALALALGLSGGMVLGMVNLVRMLDGQFAPALFQIHGHVQLFGLIGLFIYGVGSHAIPRFTGRFVEHPGRLAAGAACLGGGVILRVVGQLSGEAFTWVLSALLELAGMALFCHTMGTTLLAARRTGIYRAFMLAGLGWATVGTLANLALVIDAVQRGSKVLNTSLDAAMVSLLLIGFAGMMILGFAARTLPVFMGLTGERPRLLGAGLGVLSLGIALLPAAQACGDTTLQALAGGTLAVGIAVYLTGLRIHTVGWRGEFERYVVTAFAWLAVGAVLMAVSTAPSFFLGSAIRHAFALGFVMTMLYGYALRILPVFTASGAVPLVASRSIYGAHLLATVMRVGHGVLPGVPNAMAATSAGLHMAAFVGFVAVAGWLIATREKVLDVPIGLPLKADMKVGPMVACYPEALPLLIERGFTMLANPELRERVGARMTLRQACRLRSVEVESLLADLNQILH